MVQGKCIYCKMKKTSKEDAFPKSLLHKCAPLGKYARAWIIRQVCEDCNIDLGKLDEILAKKTTMALTWWTIKNEWESITHVQDQNSSFFGNPAHKLAPVGLFYPTPLYEDFIVRHEELQARAPGFHPTPMSRIQTPQMIITQYTEEQTARAIRAENCRRWEAGETDVTESEEHVGAFCLFDNTLIFPPKATKAFVTNFDGNLEFKTTLAQQNTDVRSDLHAILPEEGDEAVELKAFFESLAAFGTREQMKEAPIDQKVFHHVKFALGDRKAIPYVERAIAKVAFHCFLFHHRNYSGHEPIFSEIKAFIQGKDKDCGRSGNELIGRVSVTEDYARNTNENYHIFRFYVNGDNIVCHVAFFTGLLVGPYANSITLAGNCHKAMCGCVQVKHMPYFVHAKSELMKRIVSVRREQAGNFSAEATS